jgi:hypothetical protein
MKYIDNLDNFTRGEYREQGIYDVADEDPGYLQRLLNGDFSIDAEDRAKIRTALGLPEEE